MSIKYRRVFSVLLYALQYYTQGRLWLASALESMRGAAGYLLYIIYLYQQPVQCCRCKFQIGFHSRQSCCMSVLRAAEAQHSRDNPAAMTAQTITVPISQPTAERGDRPSSSAVYRNAISKNGFPVFDQKTMWQMFDFASKAFASESAIGWRPMENGKAGAFKWMTYSKFAGFLTSQRLHIDGKMTDNVVASAEEVFV